MLRSPRSNGDAAFGTMGEHELNVVRYQTHNISTLNYLLVPIRCAEALNGQMAFASFLSSLPLALASTQTTTSTMLEHSEDVAPYASNNSPPHEREPVHEVK
jgi:hypothetical protein